VSWLKSITLTITQWAFVTLLAIIAFLAAALKLRGSELHKAKVDLLKAQMDAETKEGDQKIATAREAYEKALAEWEKTR
jgi:hypothetical protein